jgi:hypothetical protein
MPEIYTIRIKNNSRVQQSFLLFQAIPKPANIPGDNVFTNVYQRSEVIQGDGTSVAEFQITSEWFAIYGTERMSEDGRVRVSTSDYQPVTLGPKGTFKTLTAINGKSPKWDDSPTVTSKQTSAAGAFTIATDGSFTNFNSTNIYFGAGAKDPNTGDVIPVQTYLAKPNTLSQLFPKIKYYIAFGNYEPGAIVDLVELGNVLLVDFTTADNREATFTLNSHNEYEPDKKVRDAGIKWSFGQANTN